MVPATRCVSRRETIRSRILRTAGTLVFARWKERMVDFEITYRRTPQCCCVLGRKDRGPGRPCRSPERRIHPGTEIKNTVLEILGLLNNLI